MGKNSINTYRELEQLPKQAQTVREYAMQWPCNTAYIYKLWREHTEKGKAIPFEIVKIRGINFIVPV